MAEVARRRHVTHAAIRLVVHKRYPGADTWREIAYLVNHPRQPDGAQRSA